MQRLRQSLQRTLIWGAEGPAGQRTTNQCRHLLKDEALCWTFLQDDRILLTNNTAERALKVVCDLAQVEFCLSVSQRRTVFANGIINSVGK